MLYTRSAEEKVVFAFEVTIMEQARESELTHSDVNARIEVYLGC